MNENRKNDIAVQKSVGRNIKKFKDSISVEFGKKRKEKAREMAKKMKS